MSSHPDVLGRIDAYYSAKLSDHGATPRGVDWNSAESQEKRFDQLLRLVPEDDVATVLDYGCGYGALAPYLARYNPQVKYVGYDVSSPMVDEARRRYGHLGAFHADKAALGPCDVVVASGIFNVKMDIGQDDWERYIYEALDDLNSLARHGFAFNMLSAFADADRMREDLYYADPHAIFNRCRDRYSRWVATLHDYGLYEFTTIVRRLA